ncbi:hypothetical protein FBZ96_1254 [Bradyrhizobium stylosanthis]|uniref:Uncharacterized protein n=1 Tax=Bradyrhizobium stylosanthis TaxID=1803665 RepID=A0A560CVI4_9BRAD|nr:hypothetical protein FBZ96_1254 [Bradyrhizobium stylosanthis]
MTAIGFVTRTIHGGFSGKLKLLPIAPTSTSYLTAINPAILRPISASSPKA